MGTPLPAGLEAGVLYTDDLRTASLTLDTRCQQVPYQALDPAAQGVESEARGSPW